MKKIASLILIALILIFAWGLWYKAQMQKRVYLTPLSITKLTKDMALFEYSTPNEEIAYIYFSRNPQALSNVRKDAAPTQHHRVALKNLYRCTEYFYKIDSASLPKENKRVQSFKTLCN